MSELLLDRAGRRRSPATMPGFHVGRPPHNKGLQFYIPRFIRHYRDRRQLGQSISQSLKSAQVRMRSYR